MCPTVFLYSCHRRLYIKTHILIPDIDCSIDIPVMVCTAFPDRSMHGFAGSFVSGILIPAYTASWLLAKKRPTFTSCFPVLPFCTSGNSQKYPPAVIQKRILPKCSACDIAFISRIFYTDAIIRICNLSRLFV